MEKLLTVEYSEKIHHLKEILRKKKLIKYITKFTDLQVLGKFLHITCKLTNKQKITVICPINSPDIYVNLYGVSKIPIYYDCKIRHKMIEVVKDFLDIAHISNKAEYHLLLFKFFMEALKYLKKDVNYQLTNKEVMDIKLDVNTLSSKLHGYGKTADYNKLMKEYYNVIM